MTPYRTVPSPRGQFVRGRVSYLPCAGIWPLVFAIVVGVPAAMWARHESYAPSVVSCVSTPIADSPRLCMIHEASSFGAPSQVACEELPADLDRILGPRSPLSRPRIQAIEPVAPPVMPRRDGDGACAPDEPPRAPSSASAGNGTRDVDVDTARRLVREYAGPTRSAVGVRSLMVFERDYTRSALVLLAVFGLALASMLRRRATVTSDGTTLSIVERGFFRVRRKANVPITDVDVVTVGVGASGPLVGHRVELACRSGERIPVIEAFTSFGTRVHERTRARIASLLVPPVETTERRGLPRTAAVALVALAACPTLVMLGMGSLAARRFFRPAAARSAQPTGLVRAGVAREGSTVVLASLWSRPLALVADEDAKAVRAVEAPRIGVPIAEPLEDVLDLKLETSPGAMVLDERGRLFVALPDDSAIAVLEIEGRRLHESRRFTTGTEPIALAITPDERTLVVLDDFGHRLETFRLSDLARGMSVELPRSPRAMTLSADGREALVTHATESMVTRVDLRSGAVESTSLDTTVKLPASARVRTERGRRVAFTASDTVRSPLRQGRIARIGDRFFVPGVVATAGDTTVPAKDGYYNASNPVEAFTMFELDSQGSFATPVAADRLAPRGGPSAGTLPLGCLLPRAAVPDEPGNWVYIACTGPSRIFRVDVAPTKRCYGTASWSAAVEVPNGPTGMAIDSRERILYVWSQDAETLTALPLDLGPTQEMGWDDARTALRRKSPAGSVHRLHPVARDAEAALIARGRTLFYTTNDPRISIGGPACASCHIDGREDALVWPTKEGPRQTPMLAGRLAGTAPYGWNGAKPSLSPYLAQTFRRLGGHGLAPDDERALIAYIQAIPTPRIVPRDGASVRRGGKIFGSAQAGCSGCHSTDVFTDGDRHDVASRVRVDSVKAFDTPSLLFVGGTAPYFHDGRYATLSDLLTGSEGTMGHTSHLSESERGDLIAYLDSLGR